MGPNKKGFWVLVVVFGLLTLLGIGKTYIEGPNAAKHDVSMGSTMGQMMAKQHSITIDSLLAQPENPEQVAAMAKQHTPPPLIKTLSELSTASIYMMLPVLMGGVATLLVLWTGKEVK